jgi:hypothetical protein
MSSNAASYQSCIVQLVSYLDRVEYGRDTVFPPERLASITGEEVLRWMNVCCFDNPTPPTDANPVNCCSSTLVYWKKAVSSFMPNRNIRWNELTLTGNPTRYYKINKMIARVRQKEEGGQGRKSQARRTLKMIARVRQKEEGGQGRKSQARRALKNAVTVSTSVCAACGTLLDSVSELDAMSEMELTPMLPLFDSMSELGLEPLFDSASELELTPMLP